MDAAKAFLDKLYNDPRADENIRKRVFEMALKTGSDLEDKATNNTVKDNANSLPEFATLHNPKATVTYLKEFTSSESALKYTTHSWEDRKMADFDFYDPNIRDSDGSINVAIFLKSAQEAYDKFSGELGKLYSPLNGLLAAFLGKTGKPWGRNNIGINWGDTHLHQALQQDHDLLPENYELPQSIRLGTSGKRLKTFGDVRREFKKEIEIRREYRLSELASIAFYKLLGELSKFQYKSESLEQAIFYTHTNQLRLFIEKVLEKVSELGTENPVVCFSWSNSGNGWGELRINHEGSFCDYSVYSPKLNAKGGDFADLRKKATNLFDWSVESRFAEGHKRINYLASTKIHSVEDINGSNGFTHILRFLL